ncbi:hypothetical protein HDK77DRAFT_433309 [Phyllosticta capitalensis]
MSCHDAFHGQGRGKSKKTPEMEKFRMRIQLLAVHCRIRHPIALPVSMPSTHPLCRDRGPRALMLYAVGRHACCAMISAYSHRVSHVCAASKGARGPATVLGTQPIACGADRRNRHTAFCKLVVAHGAADGRDEESRRAWMEELRARRSPFSDGEQVERRRASSLPQGEETSKPHYRLTAISASQRTVAQGVAKEMATSGGVLECSWSSS